VTLAHSFVEGWNTICLPFAIEATDIHADAKAFSFDNYDEETKELVFNKVNTLEAGKPYVIYVPNTISADNLFVFSNVTITSTEPGVSDYTIKFQGTYAPIAAGDMTGKYGLTAEGQIRKAGTGASIKGFRAYFELPANVEVKALRFEDIEDAISLIQTDVEENEAIYNVAGQRVQKMQKGINIINGKKILK
jgi:hypothetical protein